MKKILLRLAPVSLRAGGAVGAIVTTPPDVITTLIITQKVGGGADPEGTSSSASAEPLGFLDMWAKVLREKVPAR